MKLSKWKGDQFSRRATRILTEYGPLISFQLQEEIATKQFQWPVPTRRKSGEFVQRGLRDIVDLGTFLNSQTTPDVQATRRGARLTIGWTAPYSLAILQGGYIVGTVRSNYEAPSRDWITPALQNRPLLPFLVQRWQALTGV